MLTLTACFCAAVFGPRLAAAETEPGWISSQPDLILSAQQDWGELGMDTAAHAGDRPGERLQIGDKVYSNGLGHHANGEIILILDGQFSSFDSDVGLQPCSGGSVVFRVLVDGRRAFQSPILHSGDAAVPVHVDLQHAQELRLEAADAGDGISCDMANWANARLTRNPAAAPAVSQTQGVDIAPFARTVTWDPKRKYGARASRIEEFRQEDLFTETELKPNGQNRYVIPADPEGLGCIGLQWLNRRALRELRLQYENPGTLPTPPSVRLEFWAGESAWQGGWQTAVGDLSIGSDCLVFRPNTRNQTNAVSGSLPGLPIFTQKIRWILPQRSSSEVRLSAWTRSLWAETNLLVQLENVPAGTHPRVGIWNGEIASKSKAAPGPMRLSRTGATRLTVRYSRASSMNSDPTHLRFSLPAGEVAVAMDDVLTQECVYVPDYGLFVTRDPAPVTLASYKRRIASKKTILEEVSGMPDQTLAQAMATTHHSFQHEGPVMLSLACDNVKYLVERNGAVRFNPAPFQWLGADRQVDWAPWYQSSCELRSLFGTGTDHKISRSLHGRYLPMPVITAEEGGIRYSQKCFVAPLVSKAEWNLPGVCVIEFTMTNLLNQPAPAHLQLQFASSKAGLPIETIPLGTGRLVRAGSTVAGWIGSSDLQPTNGTAALKWTDQLPVGGSKTILVYLGDQDFERAHFDPRELEARTATYWQSILAAGIQVHTPEPFVNDALRSSIIRCYIDARSEADAARVGASIAAMSYGPLESEAHSVIRGMDFAGHSEFAQHSLDFFLHRFNTNGFLTTGYTTFGTAWHLWTVGEHYQLTHDTDWIQKIAPLLANAGHWIIRQTEKTRRQDVLGNPVAEYGLMPPGVLADWNAFAFHYTMNAYYYAALREIGQVLNDLHHPEAKVIRSAAEELRANTLRAYAWTQAQSPVLPLRDGTWIPHYPSQVHSPGPLAAFFPGQDGGRSWCYDVELGAHQLIPAGLIAPRSREAARMLDHMEDVQFLASGWFDYPAASNRADWFNLGGFSKVQPYYTRNAEIYALRDDVKPFVRSYFNTLAAMINPEVLTFWEHFHHSGAFDKTHETGYFLHQTRMMLVQEREQDLWLAPFIPTDWLRPGSHLSVSNAPTRFGTVAYEISSDSREVIEARIQPPVGNHGVALPQNIVLRLRHPEGKPIRSVTVNKQPIRSFDPASATIKMPNSRQPLMMSVRY